MLLRFWQRSAPTVPEPLAAGPASLVSWRRTGPTVMRLAALYRRVRAPGDLPGSAWPTEGPHCQSTGGAHLPQVPRVIRLQHEHALRLQHEHARPLHHELAHVVGARDGTGAWAHSW